MGSRGHVNGIRGLLRLVKVIGMEDAPCTSEGITTGTRSHHVENKPGNSLNGERTVTKSRDLRKTANAGLKLIQWFENVRGEGRQINLGYSNLQPSTPSSKWHLYKSII